MKSKSRTILLTVALLAAVSLNLIEGIRVYEGTNFEIPKNKPHKSTGMSKKSLYITKRSWNPNDELKPPPGVKGPSDADKWKDFAKKQNLQNGFPSLYKITFKGKEFVEYIKYTKQIPRLEEYTFCMWYKPNNMTHDHTLFTYALNRNEKLLRFWINAADTTFRMAVRESPVYQVRANVRQGKWHHICQSWNGVFGEWQVFLDGKRIGAGTLPIYKETYVPEGGEVILSQDLVDKRKEYNNGLDGEVFGFNMVDEAVPGEQANFINFQYKPNAKSFVPPFKKLPPMKKTYQEIKAYINKLPSSPVDSMKGIDLKHYPGDQPNTVKRTRDSSSQLKRHKPPPRMRPPPVRKIVYYRNDRKIPVESASAPNQRNHHHHHHHHQVHHRRPTNQSKVIYLMSDNSSHVAPPTTPTTVRVRIGNDAYSLHNYRLGKDVRRSTNYEIYESLADDVPSTKVSGKVDDRQTAERKARENFNLYVAREANKVYTLSSSVRDPRKQKFHFEKGTVEIVRSPHAKGQEKPVKVQIVETARGERKLLDSIPVYETEVVLQRKRRKAESEKDTTLSDSFRRLPKIPDDFIDIFTKNASKQEIEQKLEEFFPENTTTNVPEIAFDEKTLETFSSFAPTEFTEETQTNPTMPPNETGRYRNEVPIQRSLTSQPVPTLPLTLAVPVASPASEVKEFDPRQRAEERTSGESKVTLDRWKLDFTSGTDLIIKSYGLCTVDRGSPIQNKSRLIISWAETPIRIFGGAEVENARNECGNF